MTTPIPIDKDDPLWDAVRIAKHLDVRRNRVYELDLGQPVYVGDNTKRWFRSQVLDFIQRRLGNPPR